MTGRSLRAMRIEEWGILAKTKAVF